MEIQPNMQTYPNQRIINTINEGHELCDKEHKFLMQQKKAMFEAMKNLTPTTFEVWIYIASWQKDKMFALSPKAVYQETGIKVSSVQEAIKVLIRERYLIQREKGSNIYEFYEVPREEGEDTIYQIKNCNDPINFYS